MDAARKKAKQFYTTKHLPQGPPSKRTEIEQREYRDLLDYKRDAFRHILANAWLGMFHSHAALRAFGEGYEVYGGLKNILSGKFKWSGRKEDLKNNDIGLALSKKFIRRGISWKNAALEVKQIVDRGQFFIEFEDEMITYSEIDKYRDPITTPSVPVYVDKPGTQDIKKKRK
tara:strand:- start:343 stop:858 length:516 start_codon:yes stop_codon:yes gene_type:complete